MTRVEERLYNAIAQQVAALDCELVDARMTRVGRAVALQVFVDRQGGVNIDDCAAVSRHLSAWLDVENPIPGHYRLEVSSPGVDRPLKKAADFQRFVGEQAHIELRAAVDGRKHLRGALLAMDGNMVVIREPDGERRVALADIAKAKLIPQW
ncbi:ribosome maturation factor RimP [Acidithiobacillus sp.]